MQANSDVTALIGLDWGTTSFRAYRLGADGRVLDRIDSDVGILAVRDGDFAAALRQQIGPWLDAAPAPILACGMIGSRQGWYEAEYVDLPAGIELLAEHLLTANPEGCPTIRFVPGLSWRDAEGVPDVIRGEETQLVGAMDDEAGPRLFVLPGTHSKWALASGGRIEWFATFMTGEVFAILSKHSILGRLMSGRDHDPAAFRRGIDRALSAQGSGLLHALFGARSLPLFGDIPESGVASYLSGLLIGTEISEATRNPALDVVPETVTIIGRSELARHYATGLEAKAIKAERAAPDICATGLHRLAMAAGILNTEAA